MYSGEYSPGVFFGCVVVVRGGSNQSLPSWGITDKIICVYMCENAIISVRCFCVAYKCGAH